MAKVQVMIGGMSIGFGKWLFTWGNKRGQICSWLRSYGGPSSGSFFLQEHGPVDNTEAYGNFNMGAGFALYISEADVQTVLEVVTFHKIGALCAGHIEKSDEKKVIIKPVGIEYLGSTLGVR